MKTNRRHWCALATGSVITSGLSTSAARLLPEAAASPNHRRLASWLSGVGSVSLSPDGGLRCRASRRPGPWLARIFSSQSEAPFHRLRVTGGSRYRCDFAGGEMIGFVLEFSGRPETG